MRLSSFIRVPVFRSVLVLSVVAATACGSLVNNASPSTLPASHLGKFPRPLDLHLTAAGSSQSKDGEDYLDTCHENVSRISGCAAFSASWTQGLHGAAYAVYSFDLPDLEGALNLEMAWTAQPEESTLWLGLANWLQNCWEWHNPPDPSALEIASCDNNLGAAGEVLLAVIVLGAQQPTLESIAAGPGGQADGEVIFSPELPAAAQNPHYSPDSTRILFTLFHNGYNSGPAGLFLLNLDNGNVAPFLDEQEVDNVNVNCSAWHAAAHRIVFSSDREDAEEIWTIADDGSDLFRVTRHTAPPYYREPTFSPDGQWIVFEAATEAPEDMQQGSLWKVRADGSDLTQLTDGPGGNTDDRLPVWSPAENLILFQRREYGTDDWYLYTMDANGGSITKVSDGGSDTDASWSPDGEWIAYSSAVGGHLHPSIYVINPAVGIPIRASNDPLHEDGAPTWSPDMQDLVFERHLTSDEDSPSVLVRVAVPVLP